MSSNARCWASKRSNLAWLPFSQRAPPRSLRGLRECRRFYGTAAHCLTSGREEHGVGTCFIMDSWSGLVPFK